jgi:regulator of RNase E activity RraA
VLSGPAFTVKTRPGDNLMVHKALDIASPGDVVVVDAGGDLTNSIIVEIMVRYAINRGLAGIVINGSIRDSDALRRLNFPVYAAGVTHRGPLKSGPGEIGRAIAIDGMVIEPGDLIIGDGDGLLCIPFDEVEEVYEAAAAKKKAEDKTLADLKARFDGPRLGRRHAQAVGMQIAGVMCSGLGNQAFQQLVIGASKALMTLV